MNFCCVKSTEKIVLMSCLELAEALGSLPPSVKTFYLDIEYYPPGDQDRSLPSMLMLDEIEDRFTSAFRRASQKFEDIELYGALATPQLFWPKQPQPEHALPFWPDLKIIRLFYHIITPEGEWLFEKDEGPDPRHTEITYPYLLHPDNIPDEDRHPNQFRFTPKQDLLDEFYLAVAHAVARMPKLRQMFLASINFDEEWNHFENFHIHNFELKINGRVGTATWTSCPLFTPSDAVIKAWEKMAYDRDIKLVIELVTKTETQMGDEDDVEEGGSEDGSEDSDEE